MRFLADSVEHCRLTRSRKWALVARVRSRTIWSSMFSTASTGSPAQDVAKIGNPTLSSDLSPTDNPKPSVPPIAGTSFCNGFKVLRGKDNADLLKTRATYESERGYNPGLRCRSDVSDFSASNFRATRFACRCFLNSVSWSARLRSCTAVSARVDVQLRTFWPANRERSARRRRASASGNRLPAPTRTAVAATQPGRNPASQTPHHRGGRRIEALRYWVTGSGLYTARRDSLESWTFGALPFR
jgi:hypothetical protein